MLTCAPPSGFFVARGLHATRGLPLRHSTISRGVSGMPKALRGAGMRSRVGCAQAPASTATSWKSRSPGGTRHRRAPPALPHRLLGLLGEVLMLSTLLAEQRAKIGATGNGEPAGTRAAGRGPNRDSNPDSCPTCSVHPIAELAAVSA